MEGSTVSPRADQALPAQVVEFLDGTRLEEKVGHTILLMAAEPDGWPRLALLSVGEVLAPSTTELRLALYPGSGTTKALTGSGKALLSLVLDQAAYRIRAEVERVPAPGDSSLAFFRGRVVAVDGDRVGYATIVSGVAYELPDEGAVLERWRQQVGNLQDLTSGD